MFHRKTYFVQNILITFGGKTYELTDPFLTCMVRETPFILPAAPNWPIVIAPDKRYVYRFVGVIIDGETPKWFQKNLSSCSYFHLKCYSTRHGRQLGLRGKKPGTSSLECVRSVLTAMDAKSLGLQCAVCCRCMFSGMDGAHATEQDYASYLTSLLLCCPFLGVP